MRLSLMGSTSLGQPVSILAIIPDNLRYVNYSTHLPVPHYSSV
jgi:hypothetical protein